MQIAKIKRTDDHFTLAPLYGSPWKNLSLQDETWAYVIKLFTMIIYCHSMVIPSFCVIKQHYLGNYCRMAVFFHRNIYNIEFTQE
jgi:hypothetical protein